LAVFNLGYLPHGKGIITYGSHRAALAAALQVRVVGLY
jgi:hypothetical protein